ncbi:MAG: hypothetical protein K2W82_03600 [Candidatus Obscuribacterales bacterium]|nr:hypothetical protein [Candidatus Obscuribacterales bacterium]
MAQPRLSILCGLLICGLVLAPSTLSQNSGSQPFKLGVEEKDYMQQQQVPAYPSYPSYPTYAPPKKTPMMQGQARAAAPPPPVKKPPMQASLQQNQAPRMQAGVAAPGVLPGEFLGVWQVLGSRQNIEAQPQFQQGIEGIFAGSTSNIWQIQGNAQQGYVMVSDTGVSTQLVVDKVQGNTAFLRYQHQIKNTVAQEAIVMQLGPGGASFSGLQRTSIVKQGEPQPRAKVTYQLAGRRQR